MNTNRTARRIATIALALAASTGIGTAVATTSHAAPAPASTAAVATTSQAAPASTLTTAEGSYHFATRIVNEGEQDAVDLCEGGLTKMNSVSDYLGKDYFPIHNECGGAPILELETGHTVHIEGLGAFTVVATLDVMRGDDASVIADLPGEILIQTCHNTGNGMRVVALEAVQA